MDRSCCDASWINDSQGDQSGCTLLVVLVVDDIIFVANAGRLEIWKNIKTWNRMYIVSFKWTAKNEIYYLQGDCHAVLGGSTINTCAKDVVAGSKVLTAYVYSGCDETEVSNSSWKFQWNWSEITMSQWITLFVNIFYQAPLVQGRISTLSLSNIHNATQNESERKRVRAAGGTVST